MASSTNTSLRSPSPSSENDVFSVAHSLVPERERKTPGDTNLTFDGLLSRPLVLHEDLQDGCGGQLWPAGMTLAKYLLTHHKTSLHEKHIVEIGAGGGLVGLAVASACDVRNKILITDQQPMLVLMEKNISLNRLESRVSAMVYDWGSKPAPVFPTPSKRPDIVLAADCVYFEPAFPLLLQTLDDLVGSNTTCYFCFKKRRKADMRFIKAMRRRFEVEHLAYEESKKSQEQAIFLYRVTRGTK